MTTTSMPVRPQMPRLDDVLALPARTVKPRACGLTSVMDSGVPVGILRSVLADFSPYIDHAKLGIGSAYITPNVDEKIACYSEHRVQVCLGGTLFEKYVSQKKLDDYVHLVRRLGLDLVEVSNGTIELPLADRIAIVRDLAGEFTVLAEVGCKDQKQIMPPSEWMAEISALLAAGATYVITEGRNSGTAGIYRENGEIRTGLVSDIVRTFGPERLIFEAPNASAQNFLINLAGANVNLGNVSPMDVLQLEAQRQALRSETFHLKIEAP
jgi:phosphosulfolactate synthase